MPQPTRPPQTRSDQWFRFLNAADGDAESPTEVYIFGVIGGGWWSDGVTAKAFADAFSAIPDDRAVDIHINSVGGDVYDGWAIASLIRQHPAATTTYIDGLAASAASYIAIAADEVVIAPGAEVMIHDATTLAWGNAEEMRRVADDLDRVCTNIAKAYHRKAGGELADWREAMRAETWYSDEEAVEVGLADRLLDAAPAGAEEAKNAMLAAPGVAAAYVHAGRSAAPPPQTPAAGGHRPTHPTHRKDSPVFTDAELTTMRQNLGLGGDADGATILAALTEALAERAEPDTTTATPALPDGVVAIDAATLEQLRTDAKAGRDALTQIEDARRTALVDAAIKDGRVRPADRDRWLTNLRLDPTGTEIILSELAPGLVPLAEIGTAAGDAEPTSDDALYAAVFGEA